MAIAKTLKLISFDGDQTLYSDGANFGHNAPLAKLIGDMLASGVRVAVITAASYGYDGAKYEERLEGLIAYFKANDFSAEVLANFFVIGGECNYILQCNADAHLVRYDCSQLDYVTPDEWGDEQVKRVIDLAEESIRASVEDLKLRARIIRKPRAV